MHPYNMKDCTTGFFLENFQAISEQLFKKTFDTVDSDFMYVKPSSQVICVVGR